MRDEQRWTSRLVCGAAGMAAVTVALATSGTPSGGRQSAADGPAAPAPAASSPRAVHSARAPGPHSPAATGTGGAASRVAHRSAVPRTPAQIGQAALAALRYDVTGTGFRLEFLPGREGLMGETFPDSRVIRIYVRPGQSVAQVSHVLAHEVGHAVDAAFLTRATRREWLMRRGAEGVPWWPAPGTGDFDSGAGDFAEVFAHWALDGRTRFRSTVAPAPSARQLEALAEDFFRAR